MGFLQKLYSAFDRVVKLLENISLYIASIVLIFMTLLITVDTLFRYLMHKPIMGVLEISEFFLMVAIVFLGMSYTHREGGNIRIEFLSKIFPSVFKKVMEVLFNIITIILFYIIGLQAWKQTATAFELKQLTTGAVEFPIYPAYLLVVVGSLLLCLRLLNETIAIFIKKEAEG